MAITGAHIRRKTPERVERGASSQEARACAGHTIPNMSIPLVYGPIPYS